VDIALTINVYLFGRDKPIPAHYVEVLLFDLNFGKNFLFKTDIIKKNKTQNNINNIEILSNIKLYT
jgi:hypothetical protein